MEAYEPFVSLVVAIAIGFLIGMEREQSAAIEKRDVGIVGGVRTFSLYSLGGALSVLLAREVGSWVIGVAFALLMVFPFATYIVDVRRGRDRGMTSEAAFAVTILLGGLTMTEGVIEPSGRKLIVVSALAVAVTALLSAKPILHRLAAKTSKADVFDTLKFLIVAVIILPLLPNRTFGPLDVLNPFSVGLMIVLIAGLGFTGYVAIRVLGPSRGLGLTGVVGGIVSSTAVTLSVSRRARSEPDIVGACALAVVLASTIMFPRVLVEVAVVNRRLLPAVTVPLGAMLVAGMVVSLVLYRRARSIGPGTKGPRGGDIRFSNPFELSTAVKFGLIFAVVLLAAKAATVYLGSTGVYLAGFLAGATDVDAIALSMANLAKQGLSERVAATTIVLGAASNTMVKCGLAIGLGGWALGKRVVVAFAVVLATGFVGIAQIWLSG